MGGTVQFPKNFLRQAVEMIRERGGIYVADEVGLLSYVAGIIPCRCLWTEGDKHRIVLIIFN